MKALTYSGFGFMFLGIISVVVLGDSLRAIHCQLCAMMFIYIAVQIRINK